jgi:hypothetical protein
MALQLAFGVTFLGLTFTALPLVQALPIWGLFAWAAATMGLGWLAAYFVKRLFF